MKSIFKGCHSLKQVDIEWNTDNISKVIFLDNMSFTQILWCKGKGIISNLKFEVAKQLNLCSLFAIIPAELIPEFNSL